MLGITPEIGLVIVVSLLPIIFILDRMRKKNRRKGMITDKEFFDKNPNATLAQFAEFVFHKKFHSKQKNPFCTICKGEKA